MNSVKAIGLKEEGLFRLAQVLMNYYRSLILRSTNGVLRGEAIQARIAGLLHQA